jgi:hypothetical protein
MVVIVIVVMIVIVIVTVVVIDVDGALAGDAAGAAEGNEDEGEAQRCHRRAEGRVHGLSLSNRRATSARAGVAPLVTGRSEFCSIFEPAAETLRKRLFEGAGTG